MAGANLIFVPHLRDKLLRNEDQDEHLCDGG